VGVGLGRGLLVGVGVTEAVLVRDGDGFPLAFLKILTTT
jgi:hypothetical protein